MSEDRFSAGAAREDITPAVGTLLYGYNPHTVSTSVHDPLQVTAVAFRQKENRALLLSVTVGDFGTALADEIRGVIGKELGLPAGRIIVAATHTHSAPNVSGMEGWGDIDRAYVDGVLFPAMRKACRTALERLRPAELAVGVVSSGVGVNRREQHRDGSIGLGQNPWGCYDPYMTCVAIRNADTREGIVNLIHYGCHGTAAGNNHEISRDWSGVMTDRLEAETGVLTAYWNGAQGDVGPRLTNGRTTGNIRHVEELGGVAAADAMRAYRAIGVYKPGSLALYEGEIHVPRKPLPPREEVLEKLDACEHPERLINLERLRYAHYRAVMDEYEAGCPPYERFFVIPQTILSLGDIAFVPFPFEIFSEISLRMRAYAPFRYTLCLSNANGYSAYLPTEDQIVRGGYEIGCFLYNGAHPLVNNADQALIDENLRLMGV
ncbi:MAG: hypothetical protein J5998_02770 [Clostridia bacterium]|nr:hypothetical protein [Clostridia bacterium]